MATMKENSTTMKIRVATGTDAEGKTIFADRSVSDINTDLSNEDLCSIGTGLASLQSNALVGVIRTDTALFEVD